jgi:hypothetical protein
MPIIEGTTSVKTAVGEYDFAVDGGAASTITLRGSTSTGNTVPAGSVIMSGYIEVDTGVASAAGSAAVTLEGAGDLLATVAITGAPIASTGRKAIIPVGTAATSVKTTVARAVTFTISGGTVTAGKFRVVLVYR